MTYGHVLPGGDETSLGLLDLARRGNEEAWHRLDRLYKPLIHHWCRKAGVCQADRDQVHQDVLVAVQAHLGTFKKTPTFGSFRGWLKAITRSKIIDLARQRQKGAAGGSEAYLRLINMADSPPDDSSEAEVHEENQIFFRRAIDLIKTDFEERTWRAFWRTVIDGAAAADVAQELGITANAVRLARARVRNRLQSELGGLRGDEH